MLTEIVPLLAVEQFSLSLRLRLNTRATDRCRTRAPAFISNRTIEDAISAPEQAKTWR
jgi:hypothetical protein